MKPEDIEKIIDDATKQYESELATEVEFVEPISKISSQQETYFELIIKRYNLIKDEIKKVILKLFKNKNAVKKNIRKDATVKPITDSEFPEGYTMMCD